MRVGGKRIFNYRPMCLFAAMLIGGILIAEALFGAHYLLRFIPLFLLIGAFCALFFIKRTRRFAYLAVAMLLGFLVMVGANDIRQSNTLSFYQGQMSARVASEVRVDLSNNTTSFDVDKITIGDVVLKYSGTLRVKTGDEPNYNAGDIVTFEGTLKGLRHKPFDTMFGYSAVRGNAYTITADSVRKAAEQKPPFPLNLQMKIKSAIAQNVDDADSAAICQALVLGDKRALSKEVNHNIKVSGLAHVLAVSGLHITTLAGAVYFVLKKLKLNPKIAYVVVVVLTFLYSMLCSFTSSSLRAFVMTAVCGFASAFGKKQDNMSALSFAAILLLIARPHSLLDLGFHLSFSAVLGIFLFYESLRRFGMRGVERISPIKKRGTKLVESVSVCIAATLGTYPFTTAFFHTFPAFFVLSSVVLLPYVMVIYIILLVLVVFSLITTWAAPLALMKYLLIPFRMYTGTVASLPMASISVSLSVVGIVFFILIGVLLSRFVFIKRRQKGIAALSLVSIALCLSTIIQAI